MFLSEGYVTENTEMGYDPIYAMQIMQEATDDWNDICMKMIKLEHTAIMKEDAELLKQGAKEAIARFKVNLNTVAKKLLEFLERVRVQWSKIQATVATKFLGAKKQALLAKATGNGGAGVKARKATITGVSLESLKETLAIVQTFASDTVEVGKAFASENWDADGMPVAVKSKIEKLESKWQTYTEKTAKAEKATLTVDGNAVKVALEIIEKRATAVKNIETMKKIVTATEKAAIKEMDKTDKNGKATRRNRLVELQRVFNKQIIAINKATTMAVKVCKAVVSNEAPKAEEPKVTAPAPTEGQESASILDQFA